MKYDESGRLVALGGDLNSYKENDNKKQIRTTFDLKIT